MFFLSAKPLIKDEFLTVYKEAVLLTQLLFAPFGLSDTTVDTLGQQNALQLYTSVFQQFEDLVSKRVFSIRGFDDDRIIASMHEYVGENQDQEVVKEMQAATTALQNMLTGFKVVEFDFSEHKSLPAFVNVASAATAALLLSQVLTALVPTLYGKDYMHHNGEYYCQQIEELQHAKEASLFNIDADTLKQIQVRVPLSAFSPTCSFSKAPFNKVSLRCKDSVNALLTALTLSVAELKGSSCVGDKETEKVHFSLQQYHALLDLYGDSAEVKAVLQRFIGSGEDASNSEVTIANVRDSLALSSLNLSTNPTVSYINQLTNRLHALVAAEKTNKEEKGDDKEEDEATLGELETVSDALELASLSIERRHAAAQCALAQEYSQAVSLLSEDLLDLLDDEEEEKEEEEEKGTEEDFLLPTHIKVYLWTERATYLLESGDAEAALKDVNRAICLNNQYAPAYSLRAKLRMQEIAEQEQAEEEEEEKNEGKVATEGEKDEKKVEALQNAAEDALLAFLLDGSSDLALAAAAEEAAREACRLSAKNIFRDRKTSTTEKSAVVPGAVVGELRKDNLPRSWLVGSYFGAYTQLSTSLSLYTSTQKNDSGDGAGADSAVDDAAKEVNEEEQSDNLCDIDEDVKDAVSLPAVPSHLLNTVVIPADTTVVDRENEDVKAPAPAKRVAHCEKDREAYSLLLCLTELMESVTHDSAVNAQSSNVPASGITSRATSATNIADSTSPIATSNTPVAEGVVIDRISTVHQRDVTHTSVTSVKKKTVRSVTSSLLAFAEDVGLDALAMAMGSVDLEAPQGNNEVCALFLVEEGVCGTRTDGVETSGVASSAADDSAKRAPVPAIAADTSAEVRVEACRHYRAALSLLCGAGWTGLSANSDSAAVDGSVLLANNLPEHLRDTVGSMDADAVYTLTGVRFNADGSIAAIQPGPVSSAADIALKQAAEEEEERAESSESEYSQEDHHYGEDYSDEEEDPNAFGNHSYGAKRGGQKGGDYGFHFGGHGGYHGENDEDFDYSEENSQDDEEEGSDWETVGSSEEESVQSEAEEEPEEEVKPVKAAKKSTAAGGTAFAKAFKAGLSGKKADSGATNKKGAKNSNRVDEVAAAVKEIEKQMELHHLDSEMEKEAEEREGKKEHEQNTRKSLSLPSSAPLSAPVVDTIVEGAQAANAVLPPTPPIAPVVSVFASASASDDAAVITATPAAGPLPTTPMVAASVVEIVIDVSHALRARLLNLCGSLAYLAGDAVGAVQCFRTSLQFDPLLLDSQIKLGSLLVDMDEMKEASKLLKSAHKKASHDYIALLHLAEMHTHDNNFDEAVHLLRKARRLTESEISDSSNQGINSEETAAAAARAAILIGTESVSPSVSQTHIAEYARRARQSRNESLANIISLLGINLFRQLPSRPEVSLHVLQSALDEQFKTSPCPILLLCCGEVYSQAGDMVTALECFRKAQALAPNNPLCYVNAARTYQQLNQVGTAERHLQAALLLDPAMAMVRVDLAQNLLLSGHAAHALQILDEALYLARQVSEIRDVLTARTIASMQVSLEERGLYCSSGARSISN